MKNLYRKGIMVVVAIILSTAFLNAQSDHRVSNIPFSQLFSSAIYDNVVVNNTGHTGSQIKSLVTEWARRNGHKMTDPGMMLFPMNYPHMNTSADKKRLNPYWDDSPRGMGWGWDKPLWKDTCTNLCAFSENDKAALVQLLNEFAINKGNFTSTGDGDDSSDNSNNNNNNNKNEDNMTNNFYPPTAPSNPVPPVDGTPWGWIIFGSIMGLIILAIVIIMIMNARNSHLAARQEIMADQAAYSNALWNNIGQFETNKSISNTNAATNARMVAESLRHFNNDQTQQQPNNPRN